MHLDPGDQHVARRPRRNSVHDSAYRRLGLRSASFGATMRRVPSDKIEVLGAGQLHRLARNLLRRHAWLQQVSVRAWCWVDPIEHDGAASDRLASCVTDIEFAVGATVPEALMRAGRPSKPLALRQLDDELAAERCDHYAELLDSLGRGARQITLRRGAASNGTATSRLPD
ncbi:MAG TPA: hypothetical protein VFQ20_04425 [Burkholderiaceae bacterium]|nr:hypothetical protein [Burkholderiaceae bacterium]